jgi:GT2 family glycosyltransferase
VAPQVHAVVVTHRGAAWLGACLRALRAQTAGPLHVSVVDNGSSDGTRALLAAERDVEHLRQEENLGFGRANNVALSRALAAGADFALLVNDDVVLEPDYLSLLLADAEAHPEAGLFTGTLLFARDDGAQVNSTGLTIDRFGRASDRDFGLPTARLDRPSGPVQGVSGAAMLLRCSTLHRVGLFDPAYFAYYEDVELSLRAARAGVGARYVAAARARHRFGASFGDDSLRRRWLLGENHLRTVALHQPPLRAAALTVATVLWRLVAKAPAELLRGRPDLAVAELGAAVTGAAAAVSAIPRRLGGRRT